MGFMKELGWVLQLAPTKDIIMESLVNQLIGSQWYKKTELNWDLQMDLKMGLELGLMKELSWVIQLVL